MEARRPERVQRLTLVANSEVELAGQPLPEQRWSDETMASASRWSGRERVPSSGRRKRFLERRICDHREELLPPVGRP